MRVCIHRGSKEIGGSCVEIESQNKRLIIDFGLPLDSDGDIKKYLPEIKGLDGNDPSLLGILVSHLHLDHTGLLKLTEGKVKIGMGKFACDILNAAAPFMKYPEDWPTPQLTWEFKNEKTFDIGPFKITPYLVDHSAYDAYALLIESDGKRLFYSGDFRAHGRKSPMFDRMIEHPVQNIDALLLEGSSLGRIADDQKFKSEKELEEEFVKAFADTKGLAMVHTSSQNIDRIVTIFRASKRSGRKLVVDLYTAVILEATGNENIPQSYWNEVVLFIPQSQRVKIKENEWFELLKKHSTNRIFPENIQESPEKYTLLFRPLFKQNLNNSVDGASYIYSHWEGYWDRGDFDYVKRWLIEKSIKKQSIHTSGHASPVDLKNFVKAINPKTVIPIHSFKPELYPGLFPNVEAHDDGQWWEVK